MVAWFLGRMISSNISVEVLLTRWLITSKLKKKKGKFWHIFIPSDFSINWLLLPVLMNDLLYLMQNSTCFESSKKMIYLQQVHMFKRVHVPFRTNFLKFFIV